jgi:glutamate decarboxylase
MVHLAAVKNDAELAEKVSAKIEELELGPEDDFDTGEYSATVYGSKFAAMDIPKHDMPEDEMPRDVAYRLIRSAMHVEVHCISLTLLAGTI